MAPFRIGLSMLSAFSRNHGITLDDVPQVPLGWNGSIPIRLKLEGWRYLPFVIKLGRCCRNQAGDPQDATFDSEQVVLGPHFIMVQEDSERSEYCSHKCEEDHVEHEAGTTRRRWRLSVISSVRPNTPEDLQITLTRSHFDNGSGTMLEVYLDVIHVLNEHIDTV